MRDEPKTFFEHLGELRRRIIVSFLATVVGTGVSLFFSNRLFDTERGLLMLPLRLRPSDIMATLFRVMSRAGLGGSILNLFELFFRSRTSQAETIELFSAAPTEKFMVLFKACFTVGILLAAPLILYEFWMFVLPALKRKEKRYLIPVFFITLFFFAIGTIFAFFIVAPMAMPVLAGLIPSIRNQWRLELYFAFVVRLMLAFGIAFELPIVMGFMARIGVFSAAGFRKQRRIAIVIIFIVSAALTPQDIFTMFLMAIPLMGLYELGIRFAVLADQRNARLLSG